MEENVRMYLALLLRANIASFLAKDTCHIMADK
jgi:hypothetical protein